MKRVLSHSFDLFREDCRLPNGSLSSQLQQLIIRTFAPQEMAQPTGQCVVVKLARGLFEVEEPR